jgi:hypothetical protein
MDEQAFLNDSVDPWLVFWEQECRKKLVTESEKAAGYYWEFNRGALVRANLQARGEYYTKALANAPWYTIDEVRAMENRNASGYDQILLPTNNFGPVAEPEQSRSIALATVAASRALEHVKQRMITRIRKDFEAATKRGDVQQWFDGFDSKHGDVIKRELEISAGVLGALTEDDSIAEQTYQAIKEEMQNAK